MKKNGVEKSEEKSVVKSVESVEKSKTVCFTVC